MNPRRTETRQIGQEGSEGFTVGQVPEGAAAGLESQQAAIRCFEATGVPKWESIGMVSAKMGPEAASQEWGMVLAQDTAPHEVVEVLCALARSSPQLAQGLLTEWLQGRHVEGDLYLTRLPWLNSLPMGLRVDGDLSLVGCEALESLGEGIVVGGSMGLLCCASLRNLPNSMNVAGELDVRGCKQLTVVPSGVRVGGVLRAWPGTQVESEAGCDRQIIFG